jgi:hypothetical protein
VDLLRYVAWLLGQRHRAASAPADENASAWDREEAARSAAALGVRDGSRTDEILIAALLTEPTYAAAARRAGISETTLYRRLNRPAFRSAFDRARRELVAAAVSRVQAGCGEAVEALTAVARKGRRDGDRVRAAVALLEHAWRGVNQSAWLRDPPDVAVHPPAEPSEVVRTLALRLRELNDSSLAPTDKAQLTVRLSESLLRALGVEVIEKRLAALEGVLQTRGRAT